MFTEYLGRQQITSSYMKLLIVFEVAVGVTAYKGLQEVSWCRAAICDYSYVYKIAQL
jgi:hypothetical protein